MKKAKPYIIVICAILLLPLLPNEGTQNQSTEVVFSTMIQTTDTLQTMIDDYNLNYAPSGVIVTLEEIDWTTSWDETFRNLLAKEDGSTDIISMDVVWPNEFASKGWLEPLDDVFGPTEQADFIPAHINASTYNGHAYGIPWFHDSGLLYYRKDVLKYAYDNNVIPEYRPPETWSELYEWTLAMVSNATFLDYFKTNYGQDLVGFSWQGSTYEGLTCDFMEYIGGAGVYSFLNEAQTAPVFDDPGIQDAMQFMKSLITGGVSPSEVLTYQEEPSRAIWNDGNAIFHRNWPYAYWLSDDNAFLNGTAGSYLGNEQTYNVTLMPHKNGVTDHWTSCLGGWQIGLNAYSNHKDEAKDFMLWLTAPEQQKTLLFGNGDKPTRLSLYSDPDVLNSEYSYLVSMAPAFENSIPRPAHPLYLYMTEEIQPILHQYLNSEISQSVATILMNNVVEEILLGVEEVDVVFYTGLQTTDTLQNMINDYNNFYAPPGVTVILQENTWDTNSQFDTYLTKFAAQDSSFDIISMDVIWPVIFASKGWIEPLDDVFGPTEQADFIPAHIQASTYGSKGYGIPWFHDSGLLYYRKDVLKYAYDNGIIPEYRPPENWIELHDWTLTMLSNQSLMDYFYNTYGQDLVGFVWQGKPYEGLTCDFMEYIGGTGADSFLSSDQSHAIFDSQDIQDALQFMKDLISDGISPEAVVTYDEETSRAIWNVGNAIFHRNWPYCYRLSLDNSFLNGSDGSYIGSDQVFNVTYMPHKDSVIDYQTSCLGGWQLGLNAFSEHKDEAKDFMLWLTAPEQQKTLLFGQGNQPTRVSLYSDPEILSSEFSYLADMASAFERSIPRPAHPKYLEMSESIWIPINNYLSGSSSLTDTTTLLNTIINDILTPLTTTTETTKISSTTEDITTEPRITTTTANITITPALDVIGSLVVFATILYYFRKRKKK
ncbi:MAG: ABC transporter substrate-binding protein [Candidatus Thorarchaeota archaeon]